MHMLPRLLLLFQLLAVTLLAVQHSEAALVRLPRLTPYDRGWQPPVTRWLLTSDPKLIPAANQLAWRKLGECFVFFFVVCAPKSASYTQGVVFSPRV